MDERGGSGPGVLVADDDREREAAPAGWYDDPRGRAAKRWWTGSAWSETTSENFLGGQGGSAVHAPTEATAVTPAVTPPAARVADVPLTPVGPSQPRFGTASDGPRNPARRSTPVVEGPTAPYPTVMVQDSKTLRRVGGCLAFFGVLVMALGVVVGLVVMSAVSETSSAADYTTSFGGTTSSSVGDEIETVGAVGAMAAALPVFFFGILLTGVGYTMRVFAGYVRWRAYCESGHIE